MPASYGPSLQRHCGCILRSTVEAQWAKEYVFSHFFDEQNGGTYWKLHADGTPADDKKQIYSQAFLIYAYGIFPGKW